MTLDEFRILKELASWEPLTASDLKDALDSNFVQAQSTRLRSLETRGLVVRTDPAAHLWGLTTKGRELVDA